MKIKNLNDSKLLMITNGVSVLANKWSIISTGLSVLTNKWSIVTSGVSILGIILSIKTTGMSPQTGQLSLTMLKGRIQP